MTHYSFNHFIQELEHGIPRAQKPMDLIHTTAQGLQKLLGNDYLFEKHFIRALRDGYTDGNVYESPEHGFIVQVFGWAPGVQTPVHDHQTWGVMGVYQNQLKITEYGLKKTEHPGVFDINPTQEYLAERGSISYVLAPEDEIHHIQNVSEHYSVSIHVYGKKIEDYHIYDLEEGQIRRA